MTSKYISMHLLKRILLYITIVLISYPRNLAIIHILARSQPIVTNIILTALKSGGERGWQPELKKMGPSAMGRAYGNEREQEGPCGLVWGLNRDRCPL